MAQQCGPILRFGSLNPGVGITSKGRGGCNVITKCAARWSKLALLAAGVLALAGLTISPSYAADDTEIYIV